MKKRRLQQWRDGDISGIWSNTCLAVTAVRLIFVFLYQAVFLLLTSKVAGTLMYNLSFVGIFCKDKGY